MNKQSSMHGNPSNDPQMTENHSLQREMTATQFKNNRLTAGETGQRDECLGKRLVLLTRDANTQ